MRGYTSPSRVPEQFATAPLRWLGMFRCRPSAPHLQKYVFNGVPTLKALIVFCVFDRQGRASCVMLEQTRCVLLFAGVRVRCPNCWLYERRVYHLISPPAPWHYCFRVFSSCLQARMFRHSTAGQSPGAATWKSTSYYTLISMDSFINTFFTTSPVESEPVSGTPIDAEGGGGGTGISCVVA
ncbi:hypothetical protein BV25DRAFT_1990099 [Artomyces pyxidatus]|uniref:Uncharacterized protein n=1 Tax=Artomyces pyxidatus TaxID=48021 RepID=A0ACB8T8S9_9AGAM|nr:hypothetical protein BV25DRAFT_1990099 [Artomyces pyxidatus]